MNNKFVTGLIVVALTVFGIVAVGINKKPTSSDSNQQTTTTKPEATVAANQVSYKDFAVLPKTIKVKVGTTVTWVNEDTARHDVTPDKPSEDFKASELFGKGGKYQWTFNKVGTYSYFCSPHPYMKGVVEVFE